MNKRVFKFQAIIVLILLVTSLSGGILNVSGSNFFGYTWTGSADTGVGLTGSSNEVTFKRTYGGSGWAAGYLEKGISVSPGKIITFDLDFNPSDMASQYIRLYDGGQEVIRANLGDAWAWNTYKVGIHGWDSAGNKEFTYSSGHQSPATGTGSMTLEWLDADSVEVTIDRPGSAGTLSRTMHNVGIPDTVRLQGNHHATYSDTYSYVTFTNYEEIDPVVNVFGSSWVLSEDEGVDSTISSNEYTVTRTSGGSSWEVGYIEKSLVVAAGTQISFDFDYNPSDMGVLYARLYDGSQEVIRTTLRDVWAWSNYKAQIHGWDSSGNNEFSYSSGHQSPATGTGSMTLEWLDADSVEVTIDRPGSAGTLSRTMHNVGTPDKIRLQVSQHASYSDTSSYVTVTNYEQSDVVSTQMNWMAVPTDSSDATQYSTTWDKVENAFFGQYEGISVEEKLWVDKTIGNVLKFDKDNTEVAFVEKSGIQPNNNENFSVTVDFKGPEVAPWDSPAFQIEFDNGGYAYIQDTSGDDTALISTSSSSDDNTDFDISYLETYRFKFESEMIDVNGETKRKVSISITSLSQNDVYTNEDRFYTELVSLELSESDDSFSSAFSVQLGTMHEQNLDDSPWGEEFYFANLGIVTGEIDSQQNTIQPFDLPEDTTDNSLFTYTTCESAYQIYGDGGRIGDCDGDDYTYTDENDDLKLKGVVIKIDDDYGDDFEILLNNDQYQYASYWRYTSLDIERWEVYRPFVVARSEVGYDTKVDYTEVSGTSESHTLTYSDTVTINVGAGTYTAGNTEVMTDSINSQIQTSLPDFTVRDNAMVTVYVKHIFYKVTAEYDWNEYGTCTDPNEEGWCDIEEYDSVNLVLRDIEVNDRYLVHSALDVDDITGQETVQEEVNIGTGDSIPNFEDQYEIDVKFKEISTSTVTHKLTGGLGFGLSGSIQGITVGFSASTTYSYSQSVSTSTGEFVTYTIYCNPADLGKVETGTTDYDFFRTNSFGIQVDHN